MSAPTTEQIRQLSEQVVEFAPQVTQRRPSTFLSLAPKTSDSYPRAQRAKQQPLTTEALAQVTQTEAAAVAVEEDATKRRTSSLGSDASKFRFLKLGPVHWGEHQDDHKDDFHEVVNEVAVE
ncbi:hypothetical protein B0J18DRAFT_12376 [Chaetomium sp. MPI-SDFR-AT-0129]|uniref:Uncharacterized protein n=1 Tax=Dichotomopilus funicola TaxID=1934379 RepID=A0AAN6VCW5_9PEZI|nr:hypothetical protein B0J18DRAFT_12376 [Chaetomium sp. MPI-SDFR-AT-0129]KAK4147781.1 hypothetical protein C8A04DRAFT_24334 [Dichotomopilus funicola]